MSSSSNLMEVHQSHFVGPSFHWSLQWSFDVRNKRHAMPNFRWHLQVTYFWGVRLRQRKEQTKRQMNRWDRKAEKGTETARLRKGQKDRARERQKDWERDSDRKTEKGTEKNRARDRKTKKLGTQTERQRKEQRQKDKARDRKTEKQTETERHRCWVWETHRGRQPVRETKMKRQTQTCNSQEIKEVLSKSRLTMRHREIYTETENDRQNRETDRDRKNKREKLHQPVTIHSNSTLSPASTFCTLWPMVLPMSGAAVTQHIGRT